MKTFFLAVICAIFGLGLQAQSVDVTFQVDLSQVSTDPNGVHLAGSFQGWEPSSTPMIDQGNGIWTITLSLDEQSSFEYKYVNGNQWGLDEQVPAACELNGNRSFSTGVDNLVLDLHCFASCDPCALPEGCTDINADNFDPLAQVDDGSCAYSYELTLEVDMSQYPGVFNTVAVGGSWNGFCGNCEVLTDPEFDNIYSTTITLAEGSYDFKFSVDNLSNQENFTGSESCVSNLNGFFNRNITLDQDVVYGPFCWNACEACVSPSAQVRIVSFNPDNNEVQLQNQGNASIDLSNHFLCNFPIYNELNTISIVSGTLVLDPNEMLTLSWPALTGTSGEIGLYSTNTFEDVNAIMDYVQWGSGNNTRASVAVSGGVWDDVTLFASGAAPFNFTGGANDYGSSFWQGTTPIVRYDLTFQVDMNAEVISPDGVFIAGNFADPNSDGIFENPSYVNWDPSVLEMLDPDLDGVYEITLNLAELTTYEYKFVNGNAWGLDETIPALCANSGNRFHNHLSSDTVLDAVCFGSCNACVLDDVTLTVQVDMSNETVSPDGVYIVGNFQDPPWVAGVDAMTDEGNGIWSFTTELAALSTIEYKFLNGLTFAEEETVPSNCGVDNGLGQFNRTLSLGLDDLTLPLVCFSECTNCNIGPIQVTFQVDMSNEMLSPLGVHIAGDFQGWDPAATPLSDQGNGIWSVQVELPAGSSTQYKFINGNAWGEDESVPVECAIDGNREATFANEDVVLDAPCFSLCSACPLPQYTLTFRLDMNNETVSPNGVHVYGDFNGWDPTANPLVNVGGSIWETSILLDEGSSIEYLFINGNTSAEEEVPGGACLIGGLRQASIGMADVVLPLHCFGTCAACVSPQVSVTFRVDMSNVEVSPNGVHLTANFQSWNPGSTPMNYLGFGIYEYTAQLDANTTYFYKFINGNSFGEDEVVPAPCAVENGFGSNNREVFVGDESLQLDVVCYAFCEACEGCTSPFFMEFNPFAGNDDGSCTTPIIHGCMYDVAENYNPQATIDDGNCVFPALNPCPIDLNLDGFINTADLVLFLGSFGTNCE